MSPYICIGYLFCAVLVLYPELCPCLSVDCRFVLQGLARDRNGSDLTQIQCQAIAMCLKAAQVRSKTSFPMQRLVVVVA